MEYTLTVHYAALISTLTYKAAKMVNNLDASNELMTIRLRTKVHEVIVLPSENYIIIVVQNPGTWLPFLFQPNLEDSNKPYISRVLPIAIAFI